MSVFTLAQIKALAPDASSLSAAQGLARARDWSLLGSDAQGRALWGEIKGSGKTPYQARIDLSEPAFKCSCPSRKFPCKHGLALLMVHAQEISAFSVGAEPGWVSEWLDARANKATAPDKAAKEAAKEAALADLSDLEREALALKAARKTEKLAANKADKTAVGVAQCGLFLQDLLRTGLSQLAQQPDGFEPTAAQLVDAQLPGLARLLRQAASLHYSGTGWEARLLRELAQIELILSAQRQREAALKVQQPCALPVLLQADLDQALGFTVAQEQFLDEHGEHAVQDAWQVLGHTLVHESHISTRRTWLRGQSTQRMALLMTFAAGNQPLPAAWPVGEVYGAALVYYPSAAPLRALVKGTVQRLSAAAAVPESRLSRQGQGSIEVALNGYAQALAQLPWLPRWPVMLQNVCWYWGGQSSDTSSHTQSLSQPLCVVDAGSMHTLAGPRLAVPIHPAFTQQWQCLALTGNAPCTLAGEWDGEHFTPLSLHHDNQCWVLNEPIMAQGEGG